MARRRLNTRLVGIILTVILSFCVIALVCAKYLRRQDPKQFIHDGELFVKQQQWDAAAVSYGRAAGLLPKDPEVWDTYGSVLMKTGNYVTASAAFQHVVQLDPART